MPLITKTSYNPPLVFRSGHFNSIFSTVSGRQPNVKFQRQRISTPDDDFLDMDISPAGSKTAVLLVHGLEGDTGSPYMRSMAAAVNNAGWTAAAMNMRGCSGAPNRLYTSYHAGKTDDIHTCLLFLAQEKKFTNIFVVGFSLGGNALLKYAGEQKFNIPPAVKAVAAVSAPTDLAATSVRLNHWQNRVYLERFMRRLKGKLSQKIQDFPDCGISAVQVRQMKDFYAFDNLYTGPAHGFGSAENYWKVNSSGQYLPQIQLPALLINALDDPFLPAGSHPFKEANKNPHFTFVASKYGGHIGFHRTVLKNGLIPWHEAQIVNFFSKHK